jgi:hypothetical protein
MASRFKTGGRRVRAALVAGGLLATLVGVTGGMPAAQAQNEPSFPGGAEFKAWSAGANVAAGVLDAGLTGPRVVNASVAFSSASTDATGLKGVQTETHNAVVPTPGTADLTLDPAGDESYGKGSALEVGLGVGLPDENADQIALSSRAEAAALPIKTNPSDPAPAGANSADTGLVQSQQVEIPVDPVIYANALPNEAEAVWNDRTCILGQPISYGRGRAATAQLVDAAGNPDTPDLDSPLVGVSSDFFGDIRGAVDTRSFTYLINNGDGTFGVGSETHMTFAPVSLLQTDPDTPGPIVIEILGEWVMRAQATGKPGGAKVSYEVIGPSDDPDTPVIRIYLGPADASATPTLEIKRKDIFTDEGIVPLADALLPLLSLAIGEDARAIDPTPDSPVGADVALAPTQAADGTVAAGAADVIRLDALAVAPGTQVAGLRIGHTEAFAQTPPGGFKCTIPVSKTGPPTGNAGDTISWTIKIPADAEALRGLACDLVNITVTDNIKTTEGSATGTITSISGQGKSAAGNGAKATLSGLGPYKVGDPPIEVTVTAKLSGSGKITNTADVSANLANCGQGNLSGKITGFADIAKVTGTAEVLGTAKVTGTGTAGATGVSVLAARQLPTTGANRLFTGLGLAALLSAAGVYLLERKVRQSSH